MKRKSALEELLNGRRLVLNDEQVRLLRFAFALRIDAMKKGRLSFQDYIDQGIFHEDLEDADILGVMDEDAKTSVEAIFKDELIKASFNPKMYDFL